MNSLKIIKHSKELEDVEFFLNGKPIAYATMQDDHDYFSVDICAVDKNGEKIVNGFVCECGKLIENISAAFPEWEKQYLKEENEEYLREKKDKAQMDDFEKTDRQFELAWKGYLDYLKKWADNHSEITNYGMSPSCFDEWLDNEA